jgi:hypothetical protein
MACANRVGRESVAVEVMQSRIVKSTAINQAPPVGDCCHGRETNKADKEQWQADRVDDKAERRPEKVGGKKKVRKYSSRAA